MRVWLFALLLTVPFSYGLLVESTNVIGGHPVLYGDVIAYERDGFVYVYDLSRDEEREIARGSNPSLFGFTVAFESGESDVDLNDDGDREDVVIQFANVQDKSVVNTNAVGKNPVVFSTFIVFSTNEKDLGVDFSNDGDLSDDILRQYDVETKDVVNLKAVGDFPALNQHSLVFLTDEHQVNVDLNSDGDKKDMVLSVFDKETRQVANAKIAASRPFIAKSGKAVFVSGDEIVVFDAKSQKVVETGVVGSSPSIFGDVVLFERDESLYGLSLDSMMIAKLNVAGMTPSVFENSVAFVSSEGVLGDLNNNGEQGDLIVRYAKEEDIDGDDVFDFVDNCPAVINEDQDDSDKDGVGDECEVESKKPEKQAEVEEQSAVQGETETPASESKGVSWYWYLLLIIALPFVVYYGYKYYKKKQKSFGF